MRKISSRFIWIVIVLVLFLVAGCNLSPVRSISPTETVEGFVLPTPKPTQTPTPRPTATALPAEDECTNILVYIEDENMPDNTEVEPGSLVDKRWVVKNGGTCNWGTGYIVELNESTDVENAPQSFDLHPAIAGETVRIRVTFIAPEDPGEYRIAYRAISPAGTPFGDDFYTIFIVASPTE